jgi:SAM-dependent methyltransferase
VSLVTADPSAPWPFWAPLGEDEIGHVLGLAAVSRDERFLDLGCGDGRVLEAALRAGAIATGLEAQPDLARAAQQRLAPWGDRARVLEQDFHTAELDADVVFAFLSPSVLQRLSLKLERLAPGTRIVTAWFPIPDWNLVSRRGHCHLYRVPPQHVSPSLSSMGSWASPGILCFLPSRGRFLVTAEFHQPPGPVQVEVSPRIAEVAELKVGADTVSSPAAVAVDLVFDARLPGTLVSGTLASPAAGTCQLFCLYRPDSWGYWPLDAAMCRRVQSHFDIDPSGQG